MKNYKKNLKKKNNLKKKKVLNLYWLMICLEKFDEELNMIQEEKDILNEDFN